MCISARIRATSTGLAGFAVLALMGLGAEQIGTVDLPHLLLVQVGFQQITQITDQES